MDGLKSFARLDEAQIKNMDINDGLECTLALIEPELSHRIKVVREYGDIPEVSCHAAEINQVFMHLLTNAVHAIEGDGMIHLKTGITEESINIQITDTGVGIPENQLQNIFDAVLSCT